MLKPQLVSVDVPRDVALECIHRSLQELSDGAQNIFTRLRDRLAQCDRRADAFSGRLERLSSKVKAVEEAGEAIVIFAPSQYPEPETHTRSAVFDAATTRFCKPSSSEMPSVLPLGAISTDSVKESLGRKKDYTYVFRTPKYIDEAQRLTRSSHGASGSETQSEASCLLLREDELYTEKKAPYRRNPASTSQLDDSDSLLIHGPHPGMGLADAFTYAPPLGNLHDFDFPDLLPNLPGIPRNMALAGEPGASSTAAISSVTANKKPFWQMEDEDDEEFFAPTAPSSLIKPPASTPVQSAKTPLPNGNANVAPTPRINGSSSLPPPPVPPPPPPQVPHMAAAVAPPDHCGAIGGAKPTSVSGWQLLNGVPPPPLADAGKGRSDLMEAIRAAGGAKSAKLKKVEPPEESNTVQPSAATPSKAPLDAGDDLMSSLAKALELRRKGISGKRTPNKFAHLEKKVTRSAPHNSTAQPFSRLREVIPPPPPDFTAAAEHSDEEAWQT
ncbi:WAS protein family 1-like protein [Aphelenchoides avenae]|nr:WAS protein family 1-like protein [Aphelenchus avenae]